MLKASPPSASAILPFAAVLLGARGAVLAQAPAVDSAATTSRVEAASASPPDPGAPAFTLEEAYAYAAVRTPAVRIAQADLAEAEGQIRETTAIGIPRVNGSVEYQHFTEIPAQLFPDFLNPAITGVLFEEGVVGAEGGVVQPRAPGPPTPVAFGLKNSLTFGANAQALLFDATFFIALRGARLYRNLALRSVEQTRYQTRVQVAKAYLAVLIAERNLATLDRNLDNLDRSLLETRALYREGFAEKLAVDRLVLSRDNLAAQRRSIEQVIAISRNLLKFQMGYPVTEPIALATTLDEALGAARLDDLVEDAAFDPAVRPERATLAVADSLNAVDLQRIRAGYYPSLVGTAGVSRQFQRDDLFDGDEADVIPSSFVGATLAIPIFDGFTKSAQRQRALARQERTRLEIAQFEESARLALANARSSVRNARLAVTLREEAVALAEEIHRVAEVKFREGVGSSLEVNQAQSDLYAAQDALTQALYDLAVAYTDYEDALGEL